VRVCRRPFRRLYTIVELRGVSSLRVVEANGKRSIPGAPGRSRQLMWQWLYKMGVGGWGTWAERHFPSWVVLEDWHFPDWPCLSGLALGSEASFAAL
jgi:hypothetical protein